MLTENQFEAIRDEAMAKPKILDLLPLSAVIETDCNFDIEIMSGLFESDVVVDIYNYAEENDDDTYVGGMLIPKREFENMTLDSFREHVLWLCRKENIV